MTNLRDQDKQVPVNGGPSFLYCLMIGFYFISETVVWNPWEKKSRAMSDFGDEEYKQMLCVNGAVIQKPITLKPGEEWTGRLELTAVPSSFCTEGLGSPLQ